MERLGELDVPWPELEGVLNLFSSHTVNGRLAAPSAGKRLGNFPPEGARWTTESSAPSRSAQAIDLSRCAGSTSVS